MDLLSFVSLPGRKIILANKVSNGNTLIRKINIEQGAPAFDVSVLKPIDIAKNVVYTYEALNGNTINKFADDGLARIILTEAVKKGNFSKFPAELMSEATISEIYKVINEIRLNTRTESFLSSDDEKIKQIKEIISTYENKMNEKNLIDSAMAIVKANDVLCKADENSSAELLADFLGCSFGNLENNVWSAEETKLIETVSKICGGELNEINYLDVDILENSNVKTHYVKSYGVFNELDYLISDIKSNNLHPGDCEVLYSNASYSNFIKASFEEKGIPYVMASGNSALETELVQFILSLLKCAQNDFLYSELRPALENRKTELSAEEYEGYLNPTKAYNDSVRANIGWGRERIAAYSKEKIDKFETDKAKAQASTQDVDYEMAKVYRNYAFAIMLKDYLNLFFDGEKEKDLADICFGIIDFTKKYTNNSNEEYKLLKNQFVCLGKTLLYADNSDLSISQKAQILIEKFSGLSYDDSEEKSEAVKVSLISDFYVLERANVFVVGLEAESFAEKVVQSPVMWDDEKREYIKEASLTEKCPVEIAANVNIVKNQNLRNSLTTMQKGELTFMYSEYNTVELRETGASVFFREIQGSNSVDDAAGYADNHKLATELKSKSSVYVDNGEFDTRLQNAINNQSSQQGQTRQNQAQQAQSATGTGNQTMIPRKLSATSLQTLLTCPLMFYYEYDKFVKISEDREKKYNSWLSANEKGTFFHEVMEKYMEAKMPPKSSNVSDFDEVFYNQVFSDVYGKMKQEIPSPSEAVMEREAEAVKKVGKEYLLKEIESWKADAINGKNWFIIGCELEFDNVQYNSIILNPDGSTQSGKVSFNGAIDRLDGYVDSNGILQLRIVDYKTGKKKNLKEKNDKLNLVQHYIYAMATLDIIKRLRLDPNSLISKCQFNDIAFEKVQYVFPFEKADVLDVTDGVLQHTQLDKQSNTLLNGAVELPPQAKLFIAFIIGEGQKGNSSGVVNVMTKIAEDKSKEAGIESFCDGNYCKLSNVCKLRMGDK